MGHTEQQRTWVLTRVLSDELTVAEAAVLLGLRDRIVRRLRVRLTRGSAHSSIGGACTGRSMRGKAGRQPRG